jgi:hypothetical protein
MVKQLRFAAVPVIAGAMIALTTVSVWAFSQQTVVPNDTYNFNYGVPDDKAKLGDSINKSDPNSPGLHFSIERGQGMDRGQSAPFGFHSFGDGGNAGPSDYVSRPLGN